MSFLLIIMGVIGLKSFAYLLTGSVGLLSDAVVTFSHLEPVDDPLSFQDIEIDR